MNASQVRLEKMTSKEFEGWRIRFENRPAGFVKFRPQHDEIFKNHATVDFAVPRPLRGRHIGRIALQKAVRASKQRVLVAHLRKSNIASMRSLAAVGFKPVEYPGQRQACMILRKKR